MPRRKKDEQDVPQQDDIKTDLTKRRLFHEFTEDDIHILNEKIAELTEKKEKFSEEKSKRPWPPKTRAAKTAIWSAP